MDEMLTLFRGNYLSAHPHNGAEIKPKHRSNLLKITFIFPSLYKKDYFTTEHIMNVIVSGDQYE